MPQFLPFVQRWFEDTFREPTPPQRDGWDAIASGRDTLIVAPTGSGKTLASFLWALDHLHRLAVEGRLEDKVYVVYVSPLRALNNDIEKNLREQEIEIAEVPYVLQLNKRDLPSALPAGELWRRLNIKGEPTFEATAPTGVGVFDTLKAVAKQAEAFLSRHGDISAALEALKAAGVKLAVPLVSQGELIGLLSLGPRLSEQDYSTDDFVEEWPQSGERIKGKAAFKRINENYASATGTSPKMNVRRIMGEGDLYVVEGTIDYGDGVPVSYVSVGEVRDGKIAKVTDYFANPFEAPAWRADFVERMEPVIA